MGDRGELADRIDAALARRVRAAWGSDRFLVGGDARPLLVEARDRIRKLDAAIGSAVREIRGTHYQDPLIRTLCVVCGAADGSYPCSALVEADALADALGGTEP